MNELYKVNSVYKINYLIDDNTIDKIIVFYGKEYKANLNDTFKKDPKNDIFIDKLTGNPIFSKEELDNIQTKNISVLFSSQEIHFDDSIGTIKLKIFHEMKETFSLEEIYLFALKEEYLNSIKIYQSLVQTTYSQDVIKKIDNQKENVVVTKEILTNFIHNLLVINKKENSKIDITDENMNIFLKTLEKNNTGVNIGITKNKLEKFISTFVKDKDGIPISISIPKKEFYEFIQTIPKKKKKVLLTRNKIDQFLLNIIRDTNGQPVEFHLPEKEFYDYNDLLNLNINDKKYWVTITLGKNKMTEENEYPYIVNPFDVSSNNELSVKNISYSLSSINSNILLDSGKIINNNIYVCLAKDVLKNTLIQENIIKTYYPFLWNKKIYSLEELVSKEELLKEESKKLWNETMIYQMNSINLFFDIYLFKKSNLNYKITGIKYIKFIIKPDYLVKIPLDVIFKVLHASESHPLIKFNPSTKQENIFRLYTDKLSTDGRKIPFLSKNTIFKLIKTIGKNKSISVYIEEKEGETGNLQNFILDFYENGDIMVYGEFTNIIEINILEQLIQSAVNPVIQEMKTYLLESGYKINLFHNLLDKNIEIKNIHYQSQIEISKIVNINSIKSCVNSAFIVEEDNPKKTIQMRFKRVSNFNKRNSQEAFIIEKQRENYSNEDIILGLIENYNDMKIEDAKDLLKKILNENQVIKGAKRGVSDIKINPGFKTTINLNKFTSTITIDVENINNIYYLSTIPIYLDSLIRLTQDKHSTEIPITSINKLCSSKTIHQDKNELEEKFIIPKEKENIIMTILDDGEVENNDNELELEEINYSEEINNEKTQKALDLFFDIHSDEEEEKEEEEEEEENELRGGASPPSSSEKELSSFGSKDTDETSNNSKDISSPPQEQEENVVIPSPQEQEENLVIPSPEEKKEEVEEEKDIEEESISMEEPNEVKNIDGMNINNPYYFQERIQQRDPTLILTKPYANFNAYSRVCPSTTKRQPVILNQQEYDKINKEHKGFLKDEDVIKYGSEKGKEYYYICPRYWCLKTNTVIDPSELKEVIDEKGNKVLEHPTCGRILPKGEKKVKPGYYIYEFYTPPKGKEDKFKKYPGFQQDSHPQGFCLPCCFNNWKTPDRVISRNKCMSKSS